MGEQALHPHRSLVQCLEQAEHELRTPLTSIRTISDILVRYPVETPEAQHRFHQILHEEAVRLSDTVDELFAAPGSGEACAEETPEPVPVAASTTPVQRLEQPKAEPSVVSAWISSDQPEGQGGDSMSHPVKNKGWSVALAGTGINLALGILYSWSIFKGAIATSIETGGPGSFQWDLSTINDPYAVCCLAFAFAMIFSGRCQDRFGPRLTALLGGLMVGAGFIWVSQTTSYLAWVIGFGVVVGTGLGFGYGASTPPALKWFPPAKTGMIAGIVVSGFGLASVYIAPLSKYLLGVWGLQQSMLFFGVAFAVVVSLLSTFLVNPPEGFLFGKVESKGSEDTAPAAPARGDYTPTEVLKTVNFYTLWALYFIGSGAGLMVIGSVAGMAKKGLGEMAFVAVAMMAVGNAAGRIVAGVMSDKVGRTGTLFTMLAFQAALMFAAIPVIGAAQPNVTLLVLLASFIGFNYGTNLSLFPSFAKDLWGLKNFGANYGILFSAWGVGGFVMGRLSQMLKATTGSYDLPFITAGVLLLVGCGLTLTLRERKGQRASGARSETDAGSVVEPVKARAVAGGR